jgi:integrase
MQKSVAPRMTLTDIKCRTAKPKPKPYKLGDSLGLFLLVQPSGGKLWRFKYRVNGKEKKLAIGSYPEISLSDARDIRDAARKVVATGGDPALEKQRAKLQARDDAGNTFRRVAEEYFDKRKREGTKPWARATIAKNEWLLEQLSPTIGKLPVRGITPSGVLSAVRKIEAKGNLESARRALQLAGGVFRHAVATARLESDPTRDLRGALMAPAAKHRAALLEAEAVGELLRAIGGYNGHFTTKFALLMAPHVFVRPGELRQANWQEFDLDSAVWTIPAAKTKMRKPHYVPLSRQTVALLHQVQPLTGGKGENYVFPSIRSTARPMSENTLNAALRRLGYTGDEMTAHGFRATASTLLNESGKWHPDAIERALAHGDSDKIRAAYHRGAHWKERVEMAQWWSDYLDDLRKSPEIVPCPPAQGRK